MVAFPEMGVGAWESLFGVVGMDCGMWNGDFVTLGVVGSVANGSGRESWR